MRRGVLSGWSETNINGEGSYLGPGHLRRGHSLLSQTLRQGKSTLLCSEWEGLRARKGGGGVSGLRTPNHFNIAFEG